MHVHYWSVFLCVLCLLCSAVRSQEQRNEEDQYKFWELNFIAKGGCRDRATGCGLSGEDPYGSHSNRFPYGRNADAPSVWSVGDLWSSAQNILQTPPGVSAPVAAGQGSPPLSSHHPRPRLPQDISRAPTAPFPQYAPNAGQPPLSSTNYRPRTDTSWPPYRNQPARPYVPPQEQNKNDHTLNPNLHNSARTPQKAPSVQTDTTSNRKVGPADSFPPYQTSLWDAENVDKNGGWDQIPQWRSKQDGLSKGAQFDPGLGFDSGQYVSGSLAERVPVSDPWFSGGSAEGGGRGLQTPQDLFGPWESKPSPLDRVGFGDRVHTQRHDTVPSPHLRPTGKSSAQEPSHTPLDPHTTWTSPPSELGQSLKEDHTQPHPSQPIRQTSSHPSYSSRGHFSSSQTTRPAFVNALLQNLGELQGGHARQKDKLKGGQKDSMENNSRQLLSGKELWGKVVATPEYGDNIRNAIDEREKDIQNRRDINSILTAVSDTDTPSHSSIHDHHKFPKEFSHRKHYQQDDFTTYSLTFPQVQNPTLLKTNSSRTHRTRLKENTRKPQNSIKSALQNQHLRKASVTKRRFPLSKKDPNKAGNVYASSWQEFLKMDSKDTQTKEPSVPAPSHRGSYDPEMKNGNQRNNKVKGDNQINNKQPSRSLQHHHEAPSSSADNPLDVRAGQQTHHPADTTQDSEGDRSTARKDMDNHRLLPSSADQQQPFHTPEQYGDHHSDDTTGQSDGKPDRAASYSGTEMNLCREPRPTRMCSLAFPRCSGYVCDAQRFCLSVETNLTTITYPQDQQYFHAAFSCVMSGLWERKGSTCGEVEEALQELLMDRDPAYNCLLQGLKLCDMLREPSNQFFILNLLVPFHASSSFRNDLARTVHKATEYCPQPEDMRVFRTIVMRSPHLQRYLHLLRR